MPKSLQIFIARVILSSINPRRFLRHFFHSSYPPIIFLFDYSGVFILYNRFACSENVRVGRVLRAIIVFTYNGA